MDLKEKSIEEIDSLWNEKIEYYMRIRNYTYDACRAKKYNESTLIKQDGIKRAKAIRAKKNDTILDIGSGPGTLAIPLAKKVKKITCIDPSKDMISILKEKKNRLNLTNIVFINEKWEDVNIDTIENHTIAIASYCLLMKNISEMMQKMNDLAIKKIYIYWFLDETSWDIMCKILYPKIYRLRYQGLPKAEFIIEILKKLNFNPMIELLNSNFPRSFPTLKNALKDIKIRLNVNTNKFDKLLIAYINENYRFENNNIYWDDHSKYVKICWNKK